MNPAIAPFVKIPELIKELAYTLDLDPEAVINDPNEAEIYAKIIGLQNARQNQSVGGTDSPESPMASPEGVPFEAPNQTTLELAMAQSEQEVYRKQGKWNLLEQLIQLDKTN